MKTTKKSLWLALLTALALFAVACGSDSEDVASDDVDDVVEDAEDVVEEEPAEDDSMEALAR